MPRANQEMVPYSLTDEVVQIEDEEDDYEVPIITAHPVGMLPPLGSTEIPGASFEPASGDHLRAEEVVPSSSLVRAEGAPTVEATAAASSGMARISEPGPISVCPPGTTEAAAGSTSSVAVRPTPAQHPTISMEIPPELSASVKALLEANKGGVLPSGEGSPLPQNVLQGLCRLGITSADFAIARATSVSGGLRDQAWRSLAESHVWSYATLLAYEAALAENNTLRSKINAKDKTSKEEVDKLGAQLDTVRSALRATEERHERAESELSKCRAELVEEQGRSSKLSSEVEVLKLLAASGSEEVDNLKKRIGRIEELHREDIRVREESYESGLKAKDQLLEQKTYFYECSVAAYKDRARRAEEESEAHLKRRNELAAQLEENRGLLARTSERMQRARQDPTAEGTELAPSSKGLTPAQKERVELRSSVKKLEREVKDLKKEVQLQKSRLRVEGDRAVEAFKLSDEYAEEITTVGRRYFKQGFFCASDLSESRGGLKLQFEEGVVPVRGIDSIVLTEEEFSESDEEGEGDEQSGERPPAGGVSEASGGDEAGGGAAEQLEADRPQEPTVEAPLRADPELEVGDPADLGVPHET